MQKTSYYIFNPGKNFKNIIENYIFSTRVMKIVELIVLHHDISVNMTLKRMK